ncbi:MAG: cyanoexosortase B system-associated protein [Leptolyngbya sp. SIO1D8]|nr:cyanoexosortase B system-associated protein [Leptolyngbya sp. SIO1D8]
MSEAVKPSFKGQKLVQWLLVIVLTAVIAIATLPSYISGNWPWQSPLEVPQLEQLRTLMETPLTLPGWKHTLHEEVRIGGNKWSLAEYSAVEDPTDGQTVSFALLLRPQPWHKNQPEVEWVAPKNC